MPAVQSPALVSIPFQGLETSAGFFKTEASLPKKVLSHSRSFAVAIQEPAMLIDFHFHYPTPEQCPYIERFAEACYETAEKFGIDYFTLINMPGDSDQTDRLIHDHKLFIGLGHMRLDQDGPDKIDEYIDRGYRGLKFIRPEDPLDSRKYYPLYERAQKRKVVSLFHTGPIGRDDPKFAHRTGMGMMLPVHLDTIARSFPELTLVGAHMGGTHFDDALAVMTLNPNVYFDFSARALVKAPEFYKGEFWYPLNFKKILFGTDSMPLDFHIPHGNCQAIVKAVNPPKEDVEAFWGGTAGRLLGVYKETKGR
jgi:hypothetical protein